MSKSVIYLLIGIIYVLMVIFIAICIALDILGFILGKM